MSSPTAAYHGPFRLSPVSPLQSAFLNLPLELRYTVYAEIFQPRTYHYERGIRFIDVHLGECRYIIPKTCQRPQPCFLSHNTCTCSFGGAVSFLRTCQQIYIEAQPRFLLNATLELHAIPYTNRYGVTRDKADRLRSFHRKFLHSSLSGLVPGDCLRRLDLRFARITDYAVYGNISAINDCRWRLDCLQLQFTNGSIPSYLETDFLFSYLFRAMSLLRDIKKVQLTWGSMGPSLVRVFDEPPPSNFFALKASRQYAKGQYCGLLNCAFSELTSRPRTTKGRNRFTTLHREAKAIFHARMQELMEGSGLYLACLT
jgi:hypothetical protein